eukprot:1149410-Pelagomonas_calceolata.AAC.4
MPSEKARKGMPMQYSMFARILSSVWHSEEGRHCYLFYPVQALPQYFRSAALVGGCSNLTLPYLTAKFWSRTYLATFYMWWNGIAADCGGAEQKGLGVQEHGGQNHRPFDEILTSLLVREPFLNARSILAGVGCFSLKKSI